MGMEIGFIRLFIYSRNVSYIELMDFTSVSYLKLKKTLTSTILRSPYVGLSLKFILIPRVSDSAIQSESSCNIWKIFWLKCR